MLTWLLTLHTRTRAKPYGAKRQCFESWQIFGFRVIAKNNKGEEEEKGHFCYYLQSHNQTILCSYNADVLRAFKTMILVKKMLSITGRIFFAGRGSW